MKLQSCTMYRYKSDKILIEDLKRIIGYRIPEDAYLDEDFVSDFGMDSLDLVEVAIGVEKFFGIQVNDREIKNNSTLRKLSNYIKQILESENR